MSTMKIFTSLRPKICCSIGENIFLWLSCRWN